jgi:RNA polymerase sigma-70 factor (ECF subfamily)
MGTQSSGQISAPTESDLVAAAQAGDVAAFESLVVMYQELAVRVAYLICGDASAAEDVAQEAFLKAYHALPRFRREAPLRPWLLRIIANEARNQHKATVRRARLTLQVAASDSPHGAQSTPEEAALAAEQRQALLTALEALRDDDRLVIASRYFLSLSEAEMSALLGCPKGTVKSRLARALHRLRLNLEQSASVTCDTAEGSAPDA